MFFIVVVHITGYSETLMYSRSVPSLYSELSRLKLTMSTCNWETTNNPLQHFCLVTDSHLDTTHVGQPIGIPTPLYSSASQRAGMHSPPPRRALVREFSGTYESLPARSVQVSGQRMGQLLSWSVRVGRRCWKPYLSLQYGPYCKCFYC